MVRALPPSVRRRCRCLPLRAAAAACLCLPVAAACPCPRRSLRGPTWPPACSVPQAYAKVTMGSVAEASRVLASLNGVAVPSISGSHGLVVRYGRVSAGGAAPGSPKCAAGSPRGSAAAQWADEAAANLPWPIPLYGVLSSAASTPRAAANGGGGASSASGMPAAAAGVGSGGSSGGAGCAASSASGTPATPKPLPVKPAVQRCASCGTPESVELVLRRCSACKVGKEGRGLPAAAPAVLLGPPLPCQTSLIK